MVTKATLDRFKLPQIHLYANGSMYDDRRKMTIYPNKAGHIEIASPITHDRVRLSHDKLVGYYFRAPWRTNTDYRWLKECGYSNYFVTRDGRVFSKFTWDYLVGNMSKDGYLRVLVKRDSGKFETVNIHRLVAKAYIPNPANKPEVNHINGNKLDNRVENLEWVWSWENLEHALKHGLRKSVLDDETIHKICKELENGLTVKEVCVKLNVSKHSVLGIKSGCHYRISKDYRIPRNRHFGIGHGGRNTSDECYRIARKTHEVNSQPSFNKEEGSETISKESRVQVNSKR